MEDCFANQPEELVHAGPELGDIRQALGAVREEIDLTDDIAEAQDQTAADQGRNDRRKNLAQSSHDPLGRILPGLCGRLHRVLADALDARIRGKLIVKLCHVVSDDDLVLPGLRKGSLHARNIFDGFFVGLLRICQHEPHPRNTVGYRLDIFLAADQLQKLLHIISVLTHKTVPSSPFYFSGARFAPLV